MVDGTNDCDMLPMIIYGDNLTHTFAGYKDSFLEKTGFIVYEIGLATELASACGLSQD